MQRGVLVAGFVRSSVTESFRIVSLDGITMSLIEYRFVPVFAMAMRRVYAKSPSISVVGLVDQVESEE
jgi:hypothetical protein